MTGIAPLWFVNGVIGVIVVEAVVLAVLRLTAGRGPGLTALLPTLLSGLGLLLALHSVLSASAVSVTALWLAASGAAHVFDVWRRWPRKTVSLSTGSLSSPPLAAVRQKESS